MNKSMNKALVLIVLTLGLAVSACSFQRETGDAFIVSIAPTDAGPKPVIAKNAPSLKILLPEAPVRLDTRRVALQRGDGAIDYYEGMRWADFLPLTLQAALTRDLGASGKFGTVVTDTSPIVAQNTLQMRIIDFSVRHVPEGKIATVKWRYQLIRAGALTQPEVITADMPLAGETPAAIRTGLTDAYHQAVEQLAEALAEQLKKPTAKATPRKVKS